LNIPGLAAFEVASSFAQSNVISTSKEAGKAAEKAEKDCHSHQ